MHRPIGIFDSGLGGSSVWREIATLLPHEHTLYLADSANAPYGERPPEDILRLSIKNTEFLVERGCKIIVVACNTATTNAIAHLRANYPLPFIGIEPAIKPAALETRNKKVGVLATKGTLASSLFHSTSKLYAAGITILEQEGTGLVELIEAGKAQGREVRVLLEGYLQPMLDRGMDCLVLGCTHYPYLLPVLRELLPPGFKIMDSGEAVARQTKAVLQGMDLLRPEGRAFHSFYINRDPRVLQGLVNGPGVEVSQLDF